MRLVSVVLIAVSYLYYTRLGSDLLPEMDEGGFVLDYLMPCRGLAEQIRNRCFSALKKSFDKTEEVESTSRRTGLRYGFAGDHPGELRKTS